MLAVLRNPGAMQRLSFNQSRQRYFLSLRFKQYVYDKGLEELRNEARFMVNKNIKNKPENDGNQTPINHPICIAMHATATCCRKCLFKWHRIPGYLELSEKQVEYLVSLIMGWIRKNC